MRYRDGVAVAALCLLFGGCATIVNPGRNQSVAPLNGGPHVQTSRLRLRNTGPRLTIYDGNRMLDIADEANEQDHVAFCRTYREDESSRSRGLVTVSSDCMQRILFPYVELDRSVPHTLRLVGDRGETMVTVKARLHFQWIWFNAIWGVAMPVGWAIDAASGKWQYFGNLDVADAFDRAASATRSSR